MSHRECSAYKPEFHYLAISFSHGPQPKPHTLGVAQSSSPVLLQLSNVNYVMFFALVYDTGGALSCSFHMAENVAQLLVI